MASNPRLPHLVDHARGEFQLRLLELARVQNELISSVESPPPAEAISVAELSSTAADAAQELARTSVKLARLSGLLAAAVEVG